MVSKMMMIIHIMLSTLFASTAVMSAALSMMCMKNKSFTIEIFAPYSMLKELSLSMTFDFISLTFFFCVSLISSMVMLYSKFYMEKMKTKNTKRFFLILTTFVASMFMLVFSNSWMMLMMGWDGLGVTSFLLVVYYNNTTSLVSGLVTILTNRVGDCLFVMTFIFMFNTAWFTPEFKIPNSMMFASTVILLGAITKSAQFPFSSWLPAAMAAPTPVSSLVHSSTLVTAGVYVAIRFNNLMLNSFPLISTLSLTTMAMAGMFASTEMDFKKVVAMSTLSQMGFMIFAITMGYWVIALIHMMFHAFFKSCLFLSTGGLMHLLSGEQDSRIFGSMGMSTFSKMVFAMSSMSLMGFPFTMGFYSKDTLISMITMNNTSMSSILFILGCSLTVAYSMRLVSMSFMKFPSFQSNTSFKEDKMLPVSMTLIFTCCSFLSNMIFFNFTKTVQPSLLEGMMGIMVLITGMTIFSMSNKSYFMINYLGSVAFLNFFFSSFLSSKMKNNKFYQDYQWMEILSGMGTESMLKNMKDKTSMMKNFSFLTTVLLILYTMMM